MIGKFSGKQCTGIKAVAGEIEKKRSETKGEKEEELKARKK